MTWRRRSLLVVACVMMIDLIYWNFAARRTAYSLRWFVLLVEKLNGLGSSMDAI